MLKALFSNRKCYVILIVLLFSQMAVGQMVEKKATLSYSNVSIKQILREIELKWDVVFVYNTDEISTLQSVSLNTENLDLYETLSALFSNIGVQYKIRDVYVFLRKQLTEPELENKPFFTISGNVSDEAGQPLPGTYLTDVKGQLKAVADELGNFKLTLRTSDSIVSFYMIGFHPQQVKVKSSSDLKIIMRTNSILLNELVVVGYGSIQSKELTGAIESLPIKAMNNNVGGDVGSSFQGNVAGLWATNDRFRIRGVSSINSGADPLVVVDGIPQSVNLKDLNPDDIASVEFLKDAASGAIFGSRAANGVILVTTRSANFNSPSRLSLNIRTGINYIINNPEFLKGKELLQLIDDAYYNRYPEKKQLPDNDPTKYFPFSSDYVNFGGFNRDWLNNNLTNNPDGTNWIDAVEQPMIYHDLRFSLQGGHKFNNYLLSLSHRTNNDFVKDKSTQRVTLLLKNDYRFTERLKAGISFNFTLNTWDNSTFPSISSLYPRSSLLPIYAPDGSGDLFDARNINDKKGTNPLYRLSETWDDNIDMNGVMTAYADIRLFRNLSFRSDWSFTPGTRRYRYYQSKDFYREDEAIDPTKSGIILYARTLNYGFNVNNLINYSTDFSLKHKIKWMLGNNIQSYDSDFNVARFEGFPTDYFQLTNANTEKVFTRQSAGLDGYRFLSFFNRAQYNYSDKWFFEFNARADGTSRFNSKNRWGFFPGIGMSWLTSSEEFFRSIKAVDYLKLRTSYGYVGNAEVGNFSSQSTVVNWAEYAGSPGFVMDRIANPDIRWEKQLQFNAGASVSMLRNRISLTFDWYFKKNEDLLVNYKIGDFQGYFNTNVTVNTGSLNNKGFDLSLISTNLDGTLKWRTEFTLSAFSSEITKLSSQQDYIEKGVNRVYVGYPMALYFLPLWAGVDPETGHELIYEVEGPENNRIKTGNILDAELLKITEYRDQRVIIKNKTPYPKLYGGLNNNFTYKNWELSLLISFQIGNWIYHNGMRQNSYVSTYDIQNKLSSLRGYWTPENKLSQIPLLYNSQMASRDNTRYLVDGSYLRLRNLTLNYNLDKDLARKMMTKEVQLQIQAQNLLTLSKFKYGDPEISMGAAGADANLSPGNVGLNHGIASINVGIKITL